MRNTYKVYKLTNIINNKIYFGVTKGDPEARWNKGNGYKHNPIFYNDIQKYGWDNIKKEVLIELEDKDQALLLESQLMKEYNTTDSEFGYNILAKKEFNITNKEYCKKISKLTSGKNNPMFGKAWTENQIKNSKFTGHHTEETKLKISKANKGKIVSKETREKLSQSLKGRKYSEETIKKMSEAAKNRVTSLETREKFKKRMLNTIWINKDGKSKNIQKEELNLYLSQGWVKGRGKLKKHTNDNSNYSKAASNRVWLHKDSQLTHCQKEELDKFLSEGWIIGKVLKNKSQLSKNEVALNRVWLHKDNQLTNCNKLDKDKLIKLLNEGWTLGMK